MINVGVDIAKTTISLAAIDAYGQIVRKAMTITQAATGFVDLGVLLRCLAPPDSVTISFEATRHCWMWPVVELQRVGSRPRSSTTF